MKRFGFILLIFCILSLSYVSVFSEILDINFVPTNNEVTLIFSFSKQPKVVYYGKNESRTVHYILVDDVAKGVSYLPISTGSVEGVQVVAVDGKVNIFCYTFTPINANYNVTGNKLYVRFPYSISSKRITASFNNIKSEVFFKDLAEFFGMNIVLYNGALGKGINIKANNLSVEDILRASMVSTGLSYAYGPNQTMYIGSAEEIQQNFAIFWQIYDGQVNVEKLRSILSAGVYAGLSKDKSKLFVYGGINEHKMITEALLTVTKDEWYYIPYNVSNEEIRKIMSEIALMYKLTPETYQILETAKKIAIKSSFAYEVEKQLNQILLSLKQRQWNYISYDADEQTIETLMEKLKKIYSIVDYVVLPQTKKVAVMVDNTEHLKKIEEAINAAKVQKAVAEKAVEISYSQVDLSYPQRVADAMNILYPKSSPKVINGKLYIISGYEKQALELSKDPLIGNPWNLVFEDITEDIITLAADYLGILKDNYIVKSVDNKVAVTLFSTEATYKKLQSFIDFFSVKSVILKVDDNYLKKFNVKVLQSFSDGTKLISGRVKEIEKLQKAIAEEVINYTVKQLPTDPSADVFGKLTGYSVEAKDGYLIFTVSKFEVDTLNKKINEIRSSYNKTLLVVENKYSQQAKESVSKIFNVQIYDIDSKIIILGTSATEAKKLLDNFVLGSDYSIEPVNFVDEGTGKMLKELFNVTVYQTSSSSYIYGKANDIKEAKKYLDNIKIEELKVDFPVSQSHLDYLSKMYNVQVEFFNNLSILKIQGLKENVENATKLILNWNSDEAIVSMKIFENGKKEDIEKLANIVGAKVSVEQIGEVLYIRGRKEHIEKLIQEVQRLQSDSKKTYATFNYPSDLDGVIKTLYGVETYKIERGYIVYGSKEQLERVTAFLTDLQNEQKSIQIFDYPSELNEVIKQYYKVETFATKNGYIVIGFKEQLENIKNFLASLKISESSLTVVQNTLDTKDLESLINAFDPNVKYFPVKDKVYLIGNKETVQRIKNEIESFDANKEYNLINENLILNVKDKSIKEVLFESSKILSTEVIFLSDLNNNCSVRLTVKDFETLLEYFKSYNIIYEKVGNIYYVSQKKETTAQVQESSNQPSGKSGKLSGDSEEVSVQNGLITINVSNKNVGEIISNVMNKLNKSYKLEKVDTTIYSMHLRDVDYETFKSIFSSWVNFTEFGSVTYISPKNAVVDSKNVSVNDGLITAKVSDENLSSVLQSVFEGFGYPVVFAKPIDKRATMSIVDVDFETFKSIMFNYGISIKKSGNVYIVDATEEATKVRTTYTFKVPRNADKVEELIKFYGGKTMVSPSAGLIVAYDLDPKNVDDINKLVEQFITAKIVSIEARIIDEAESSGLSAQIQTLFKSGNTVLFGSEGLKLNLNIMDILDGTIIDKILEEAQVSFGTYGIESNVPTSNNGKSKLLASPNLMTKSGEASRIFIGDSVPVKVRTQDGEEIRNIEGGIELKITPYVNSDGTIDLEISTTVSNFDFSVQIGGLPKINKREASTKITIKDGQTLIIGGLSREEKSKSEWKVPILGDIPIIGFLFKGLKENVEQRNITIFITAKVIEVSGE